MVLFVNQLTPITEEPTQAYLDTIEGSFADISGVSDEDVEVEITYVNSGTINTTSTPEDIDAFSNELTTSMSELLGKVYFFFFLFFMKIYTSLNTIFNIIILFTIKCKYYFTSPYNDKHCFHRFFCVFIRFFTQFKKNICKALWFL